MRHTQYIYEEINGIPEEVNLFTEVNVNKEGEDFAGDYENPPSDANYELEVNMSDLEWDTTEYTDEQNKLISEFAEKNKDLLEKKFEKQFKLENPNWQSDKYAVDYEVPEYDTRDDEYEERTIYRQTKGGYSFAKGGKVKMYAILVSPMGETIADVEVENADEKKAREKFREMGITQSGSIRFSNRAPHYYEQGGELEEVLMDKIYDAEFGMYRIGDYFIIPDESEKFPYHVTNREGAILYKAESLMDAADWADSRYYENGGLVKALELANVNLNKNGIVLTDANNTITLIAYNSGNQDRDASIYNKALIYRAVKPIRQANEIIERFDNKQYENFDESKIQSYKKNHLIIVSQNEIIYDSEAENILGQEIVVVAKDLDKDGSGKYKFRFLVFINDEEEAKKEAARLWEKSFSDLDLTVVEILTDEEWRKKYFKEGGLVSFDELAEATTQTLKDAMNQYQERISVLNKIVSPTVNDFAEFSGLSDQVAQIKKILLGRGETFKKGGKVKRVRFIDKVESISERLEGTKVPAKLKKDYGGRYSREEAEDAARRIAGAQLRDRKMSDGGMFPDVETFEQFKKKLPEIKNPFWGEEAIYKANFDSYSGTIRYFKGGRKNANSMSLADAYASYLYQTYKIDLKRLPEEEKKRLFGKDAKYYKLEDGGEMAFGGMTESKFIKLSDYYRTLPDIELLVGLRVYDEINEEYIYIKSVEGGIWAGKNKNDDEGLIYSMRYLLVNKKDIP